MKKIALTIAIVLGITLASFAQKGGGLFQRGITDEQYYGAGYTGNRDNPLMLPQGHGLYDDQEAPLGGGVLLLIGFGAAYAMKKRKEK